MARLNFNKSMTCPQQNTHETRQQTLPPTSPRSYENPFCFVGLTTRTNFSTYLFIVTTPDKLLSGWIGLPTESTASFLAAQQTWLTLSKLLGHRMQFLHLIQTDAGTAFTSEIFTAACTKLLGIKLEAAAPEHQEMMASMKVHNTANTLLNTSRLGRAFFHHAHTYAVQIINSCHARNVTDQNGNPTTPFQLQLQPKTKPY
jgi:hypothetical protein